MVLIILITQILIDIIKTIKDPEEPGTLEELKMVDEDLVAVKRKYINAKIDIFGNFSINKSSTYYYSSRRQA